MKKIPAFLILISLTIIFIFSCQKDKIYQAGESNNLRTTVTGIVLDESNAPLSDVTVTAYGQTTTTNEYGTFVLKNINANKDRCVLQFSKTGFFDRTHGFIASGNMVNYVRIVLLSNASSQTVSASSGGTVVLTDGSSVDFQPNSFVTAANGSAYSGTVNIAIKHLSPDDANFGFMIPGGDLLGKNLNDEDVVLISYGMLGVELTGSSGEALQLAAGSSATLTMAIAASQLSSAPATIPLWYFDEITSLWKEEGAANKVGNNYVGTVNHFSWWNCDDPCVFSRIKGKVVDCNGIPMPNIVVSLNGMGGALTDQNGEYTELFITGATNLMELQVLSSNNNSYVLNSQVEIIPTLTLNQVYIVPDLVVPCPTRVIGSIKNCSGENTDGFVSVSNGSFYSFQYTAAGSFNLPATENAQATFYALNSSYSYSQTITTLAPPNNLNVGNILLCDPVTVSANSFTLNGGSFSNQTFDIALSSYSTIIFDSSGMKNTYISMSGNALPNFTISNYHININDTLPGPAICSLSINMSDPANNYFVYGSGLSCNLTQVATVGNKIKGNYFGVVVTSAGGSTSSAMISGAFDVTRTQ